MHIWLLIHGISEKHTISCLFWNSRPKLCPLAKSNYLIDDVNDSADCLENSETNGEYLPVPNLSIV